LFFQRRALRAKLAKSSGNHDRGAHSRVHAFADDARHRGSRRYDDGKVHLLLDLSNGWIGRDAENRRMVRIHGIDVPAKRCGRKIGDNRAAYAAFTFCCADHCHASRVEGGVQGLPRPPRAAARDWLPDGRSARWIHAYTIDGTNLGCKDFEFYLTRDSPADGKHRAQRVRDHLMRGCALRVRGGA
jgi:hypothetical protein